jgi:hydrogenase maturation protein HypF
MSDFPMCEDCQREYSDPADRRFHAEPVACAVCGPQLYWQPGDETGPAALERAVAALLAGRIIALKGLGGYHLACDATGEQAVARLRAGKLRWAKPFAVMVADLELAGQLARLDRQSREALDPRPRSCSALYGDHRKGSIWLRVSWLGR